MWKWESSWCWQQWQKFSLVWGLSLLLGMVKDCPGQSLLLSHSCCSVPAWGFFIDISYPYIRYWTPPYSWNKTLFGVILLAQTCETSTAHSAPQDSQLGPQRPAPNPKLPFIYTILASPQHSGLDFSLCRVSPSHGALFSEATGYWREWLMCAGTQGKGSYQQKQFAVWL